jgi:hypothetical protein
LPDSPVREACQADKPAGNLAQVGPVLVLAVDPVEVAVAVPALGVDPAVAVAAVAAAEAVFH